MKLTSEQKEAERVKFIEVHKLYAGYLERNERGHFISDNVSAMFMGWLACRESIEIEVPECPIDFDSAGWKECTDEITKYIKSQGFTVVTK